jgi:hypothetical protein
MSGTMLVIETNRSLQRELAEEIRKKYPDLKPAEIVRKAHDIPQLIEIAIDSGTLVASLVSLALQLRQKQPDQEKSKITVEIRDGVRTLRIDAVGHEADINKAVEDFFKKD